MNNTSESVSGETEIIDDNDSSDGNSNNNDNSDSHATPTKTTRKNVETDVDISENSIKLFESHLGRMPALR